MVVVVGVKPPGTRPQSILCISGVLSPLLQHLTPLHPLSNPLGQKKWISFCFLSSNRGFTLSVLSAWSVLPPGMTHFLTSSLPPGTQANSTLKAGSPWWLPMDSPSHNAWFCKLQSRYRHLTQGSLLMCLHVSPGRKVKSTTAGTWLSSLL